MIKEFSLLRETLNFILELNILIPKNSFIRKNKPLKRLTLNIFLQKNK